MFIGVNQKFKNIYDRTKVWDFDDLSDFYQWNSLYLYFIMYFFDFVWILTIKLLYVR